MKLHNLVVDSINNPQSITVLLIFSVFAFLSGCSAAVHEHPLTEMDRVAIEEAAEKATSTLPAQLQPLPPRQGSIEESSHVITPGGTNTTLGACDGGDAANCTSAVKDLMGTINSSSSAPVGVNCADGVAWRVTIAGQEALKCRRPLSAERKPTLEKAILKAVNKPLDSEVSEAPEPSEAPEAPEVPERPGQ